MNCKQLTGCLLADRFQRNRFANNIIEQGTITISLFSSKFLETTPEHARFSYS